MCYIHQSHVILTANLRSRLLFFASLPKRNHSPINIQQVQFRLEMRTHVSLFQSSTIFLLNVIPKIYCQKMESNLHTLLQYNWYSFYWPRFSCFPSHIQTLDNRESKHLLHVPFLLPTRQTSLMNYKVTESFPLNTYAAHRAPNSTNNKNLDAHITVICCPYVDILRGDWECIGKGIGLELRKAVFHQKLLLLTGSGQVIQFFLHPSFPIGKRKVLD